MLSWIMFFALGHEAVAAPIARHECVLIMELASGKTVKQTGGDFCRERLSPFSTFKVPLALMAFDAGVLKENETLKWDGTEQFIASWEKDHNARSWLKESVVWFSQRLTPRLGMKKIQRYLKDFRYGNEDFSGGREQAWLSSTLKISPEEQVAFLRRLEKKELGTAPAAVATVLRILPEEKGAQGWEVHGKTGTGSNWKDPARKEGAAYRIGWYVGLAKRGGKSYAFAVNLTETIQEDKFIFSGKEAKEIALKALQELP